ncbi:MAG: hypothetical protein MZV64_31580 [Ignavibacteriales bacterium]|nr:hypothetical protein [Ignavibacteriales bacterium]
MVIGLDRFERETEFEDRGERERLEIELTAPPSVCVAVPRGETSAPKFDMTTAKRAVPRPVQ